MTTTLANLTPSADALSGRRIVLTGASGVLGSAVARRAARLGAELVLLARRRRSLEELDDQIAQDGGKAPLLVELDALTATSNHYRELADALAPDGVTDLVLAAGMHTGLQPIDHLPPRDWERILKVNLHSPFELIHTLLPLLKATHAPAHLVAVTDSVGRQHKAFWGAYGTSKAALDALIGTVAQETEGRVCCSRFDPGPLRSPIRGIVYPAEAPQNVPDVDGAAQALVNLLTLPALPTLDSSPDSPAPASA